MKWLKHLEERWMTQMNRQRISAEKQKSNIKPSGNSRTEN